MVAEECEASVESLDLLSQMLQDIQHKLEGTDFQAESELASENIKKLNALTKLFVGE